MRYCFGVDIGGTTVKMGLFGESGEIIDKWEIVTHTENKGEAILPDVAASILNKMKERELSRAVVLGIGVGVPAPVSDDGVVDGSANLGWEYKEAKKELEHLTGLKARFGNDANVAALGEMWKGGGLGEKNMVMVTLGTGVGGGIVSDGRIVNGAHGAAGEIGHMHVNDEEPEQCGCGNYG
ncbi:ROK family protein, partial [Muricomes intestini]